MKKTLALFFTAILVFALAASPSAMVVYSYGDWTLTLREDIDEIEYSVNSYAGEESAARIPASYGGYRISAMDPYAFAANNVLKSLRINGYITKVSDNAFISAKSLEEVILTSDVVEIGADAFCDTPALKSVNLEITKVQEIKENTFQRSGIEQIELPKTCNIIGEFAFANCTSLEKITIPASVTQIADNAFDGCDKLVIYCCTDSYAHQYAVDNEIEFVLIDAPVYVTFLLGDTDGDGEVTIMDATKIQRVLALLEVDVDGMFALRGHSDEEDDALNIMDATRIQRFLARYAVSAPIGEEVTVELPKV